MSRQKKLILMIVIITLVGSLVYYNGVCFTQSELVTNSKPQDKHSSVPIAVVAVLATQRDVPVYLNGLGTVTGLRTVTVRSRLDGELVRVAFKEGQIIQEGELLAEIDSRPYQVQLLQAEGQLQRDDALLKNAETDWTRYKKLLEQDSISVQQAVTQASLVKQYQGTVAMDRAAVANAKLQLSYTKITAPINGRVGLRLVDQGNIIHANDANGLVVITQTQPISVVFTLPEDVLPVVTQQLAAGKNLSVDAYDRSAQKKLAQGQLVAVDNQIDLGTGTVKLKSQFSNTDAVLFANQFVNIKMLVDTLRSAVTIPSAGLQNGASGKFVYVVKKNQTVAARSVKLGLVDGELAVIQEGLQANELIVVDGADKLREGSQVKLIKHSLAGQ